MTKRLVAILSLTGLLLTGCSEDKPLTQNDCLKQGKFKFNDKCMYYEDIPQKHLREVWDEVATEIAEVQGISKEEALQQILDKMVEYSENNGE